MVFLLYVWYSCKSVNNAFFFSFWRAFWGWLILVYLGLEGLGVFVFLVFFCLGLVFVYFALFLFWCWIVFWDVFFFFWGGGEGLFLFLVFVCSCLFCLFVLECLCYVLCFVIVFFGLLLLCSLCLLEWSRCYHCFVLLWFVLFVFVLCLFVFVFCLFVFVSFCFLCESLFSLQF